MRHLFIVVACIGLMALILPQRPAAVEGSPAAQARELSPLVAPQAVLAPAVSLGGSAVVVLADGFAPREAVTFRFGFLDPFSGSISNPLFTVSGVTDAFGRLGDRRGTVPVAPQTLPATGLGGLYTLQATGATSGLVASTFVFLPFLLQPAGLQCASLPISPGGIGYAFAGAPASLTPGTAVEGIVGVPTPIEVEARTDRLGRVLLIFRVPPATPAGSYGVLAVGLRRGAGHQEQLLTCTLTVGAHQGAATT